MICRLCLKDLGDVINIFDVDGLEANMASVVGKYFWFVPRKDDPISTAICRGCWIKVHEFHEFYELVESAHRHMTERFIVKTENTKTKMRPSLTDLINFSSLPSKREPDEEFDELDEVPFNMLMEDTTDEPGKTVAKAAAIALGAGDSRDDLSLQDFSHDDFDNDKFEGHNEDHDLSFDGEAFMTNILTNKPKEVKQNDNDKCNDTKRQTRRSARNSNKCKEDESQISISECKAATLTKTYSKRRGRPKKEEVVNNTKSKFNLTEDAENPEDLQDVYKHKMKKIDDQISQYMTLHCEVCSIAADNFASLRVHMRAIHGINRGYAKCCNKKFLKRALLLDHIRQHLDPECYKCDECERTFADRQSMRNHFLIKHQKDEDKIFACSQCPKRFVRKYLLEQHKVFTHRDRSTTCKTCNRRFETMDELSEHNKEHCNYGTMCDICAKVIRGRAAFIRHQLEHQGVSFPKVQCDLCGSWHKDKYSLNKHKKRHIESQQQHVCDICHKVSPSRSAMLSHKRYVHGTERSYECGVCKKCFKKPLSLKEHMTTHTGEVLYRCPHCPKTFNSNANMHSHRKKVHPLEFEETRKLRKQNAHFNDKLVPQMSTICLEEGAAQALLVINTGDSQESHNIIITTADEDIAFTENDKVETLSKSETNESMTIYRIR